MVRRTAQEAEETHAALVRAARGLFTEKGFQDATLEEVAARAGVTRGAVYHHFADKRELFAAVFVELEREVDAAGKAAAAAAATTVSSPREAFLAGCRAYLGFAQRPDFHRIVLVDGPAALGPAGWHAADSQLGLPTLDAAVKALMAVGVIEPQPPRPLALLLFGALNEAGFALARGEPDVDLESALSALGRILDGLAPRRPDPDSDTYRPTRGGVVVE
jgi:AcrR family transcriptional regulator